jgi:hypothetical protein
MARIRKAAIIGENESGSNGPDSMFVVDLLQDGQCVETREIGQSRAAAVALVEDWETGAIQLLVD